jgi:lysophospholipase L1-like esterase
VINAGCLGERADDPATRSRLADKLATYQPDVVLLLEGVNDLGGSASIAAAVQGVQTLVADARNRGAQVMVGTLLPQIAGSINAGAVGLIAPFNALLLPAAASAGARVVDLHTDIATDLTDWISPYDGLHPTAAGYQEMARVWFRSIQGAFESTSPTMTMTGPPVRASTIRPFRGSTR